MSPILGVFGSDERFSDEQVHAMLGRMSARGTDRVGIWRDDDDVLAADRYDWELDDAFSGSAIIAQDGQFAVAADATIYYRAELFRALHARDVSPAGGTPARRPENMRHV